MLVEGRARALHEESHHPVYPLYSQDKSPIWRSRQRLSSELP